LQSLIGKPVIFAPVDTVECQDIGGNIQLP